MKQGNQFYLELQIEDKDKNLINIDAVEKIVFQLGELTKTFDGVSEEVTYTSETQSFKIFLTQEETFEMYERIILEARVKFINDIILGTQQEKASVYSSINKDVL